MQHILIWFAKENIERFWLNFYYYYLTWRPLWFTAKFTFLCSSFKADISCQRLPVCGGAWISLAIRSSFSGFKNCMHFYFSAVQFNRQAAHGIPKSLQSLLPRANLLLIEVLTHWLLDKCSFCIDKLWCAVSLRHRRPRGRTQPQDHQAPPSPCRRK